MKNKKIFILIIMILFCLFSVACTKDDIYVDDIEDESPITIYILQNIDFGLEEFVSRYNMFEADSNRQIEVIKFKQDDIEGMYIQILNEISLGGGPDIIIFNWQTHGYMDISKVSRTNAFSDLDILINNSKTFDLDDYNKIALDAGVIDNKRVFMPISYEVPYLIGVEDTFAYYNLDIPQNLTMDSYIELLERYYQATNNEATLWGDSVYLLAEFYETGELIEKSEQLERLFEVLKEEHKRYAEPPVKEWFRSDPTYFDQYDPLINKDYLFAVPRKGINQYRRFYENHNYIDNYKKANMIWFNQPSNKSTTKAYTEVGLAININSKHKNEAFEFVEYVLSHGVQSNMLKIHYLPVSNVTYSNEVKTFLKDNGYDNTMKYLYQIDDVDIPLDTKQAFVEYVEGIESCEYIGSFKYVYTNIMQQSIEDYYNDKMTFDEMIDEINNKLSIYYSE